MKETYASENNSERERLQAFVAGLSENQLAESLGHGWTVSAALAHLAFWDRLTLKVLEDWERSIIPSPISDFDAINDALLPEWLEIPPLSVARLVITAAEQVDRKVVALAPSVVESIIVSGRLFLLYRSRHRRQHREEMEHALKNC